MNRHDHFSEGVAAEFRDDPRRTGPREGRWAFRGCEAPREIQASYIHKRVPQELRKRGAANPVRYWPQR